MIDNEIEKGPDDIIEKPPAELYNRLKIVIDKSAADTANEKGKLRYTNTKVGIDEERRDMIKGLGYL